MQTLIFQTSNTHIKAFKHSGSPTENKFISLKLGIEVSVCPSTELYEVRYAQSCVVRDKI